MRRAGYLLAASLAAGVFYSNLGCAQSQLAEIIFGSGYEDSNTVEWIQRHSAELTGKSIFVNNVWVTASFNSNQAMFVQESVDVSGSDYPQYAGIRLFNPGVVYSPGSCVSVLGDVSVFQGSPQISPILGVYLDFQTNDCGTPIAVYDISNLDDIATDIDPSTTGDQPGSLAAQYNGALIRVSSITAQTSGQSVDFRVAKTALPVSTLIINGQFFQYPAAIGETFSSITGILDYKNNHYYLSPRGAADISP